MDFFNSVFLSDDDPPAAPDDRPNQGDRVQDVACVPEHAADSPNRSSISAAAGSGGAWSFGGLLKTITSRSETVIQTYKRDLQEFGSGLRKETAAIGAAATKVVRDLPGSLEASASVAQESLESMGQAIDDIGGTVWRGTAEIISHGKEALLSLDAADSIADSFNEPVFSQSNVASSKRLSRFESQVLAIQSDPSTFTVDPEDLSDFGEWKLEFRIEDKEEDIESLLYESNTMEGLFEKLVPEVVDRDAFWTRYFYRVYKLRQAEDARANLVKRVISREEDDEDLSWEVDEEEEDGRQLQQQQQRAEEIHKDNDVEQVEDLKFEEKGMEDVVNQENLQASESSFNEHNSSSIPQDDKLKVVEEIADVIEVTGCVDKSVTASKVETSGSSKDSDFSIVSTQPPFSEEDDLGWDEIEDLGTHNDKKGSTPNEAFTKAEDLQKKLSATVDDEDLSWDIED